MNTLWKLIKITLKGMIQFINIESIFYYLHDIQIYSYTKAPPSSPLPRPFCKRVTINGSSNIINICRIFHQRPYCKLVTFYHQVINGSFEQKYFYPLPILPELPFATFANRPPVAVNSNSKETKIWNLSARRFASTAAFPPPSFQHLSHLWLVNLPPPPQKNLTPWIGQKNVATL